MKTKRQLRVGAAGAVAALTAGFGLGCAALAADYSSTVLSYGPVAYWRLNETTPVPSALTAASLGTVPGAAGYGVLDMVSGEAGLVGNAFRFKNDGYTVGYCGSKIDVPFNPALNPKGSFTVEFWAKPSALMTDLFCPLSALNGDGGVRDGWLFYQTANAQWLFRIGGGSGYAGLVQGGAVKAQAWQQVVGVYDGADNSLRLYVDGALAAGPLVAGLPFVPNDGRAFRMGGTGLTGNLGAYAGNRGYDGLLDEVAIYPVALSASRVAAHYNKGINDTAHYASEVLVDSPLGYWNLDEPAYTEPAANTLPLAANSGSLGSAAAATYTPGAISGVDGPPFSGFGANNKAVSLNGSVGHLAVPNPEGINVSGNFTVTAWIKPSLQDNIRDILAHGQVTTPDNREVFFRINAGVYQAGFWDGTDSLASAPMQTGDIGNWIFLAATYDGNGWKLYRYDTQVGASDGGSGPSPFDAAWSIGSMGDPAPADGRFFGGAIDEVAVFAKALTATQIHAIVAAAKAPPILLQPVKLPAGSIFAGDTLNLKVVADGQGPLSYVWTKNGLPIGGATSDTYSITGLKLGDAGTYAVQVSNANGTTTSSVDVQVVGSAPVVGTPPASATRFVGSSVTLSPKVTGSAPLAYQWKHAGQAISGATDSTLTLSPIKAGDAGNYTVTVKNDFGEITSDPAALTVLAVPAGFVSSVATDGPTAYWRLGEGSGTVAHDYWGGHDGAYRGTVNLGRSGYSALDGDTAVSFGSANTYVGGISGTEINFTGPTVNFTLEAWVNGPPTQVAGAGIIAKGTGTNGGNGDEQFAIDVNNGNFRFYIRKASDNTAVEVNASVGPNGSWQHVVGVYDSVGGFMHLYVNGVEMADPGTVPPSGPRTSSHPVSIGARRGGVDPSYDLYFDGSIDEVAIYSTALSSEQVAAHYAAQYGNSQPPLIQVQPADVTTYATLPVSLSVAAAGTQPISFQWKKNGNNIGGATDATYTIDSATAANAGNYSVLVSNPIGSTNSAVAKVTILPIPTADVSVPGLVAHYTFDSTLVDATGRGNNGTAKGGVTYSDGQVGSKSLHYATDASDTANVVASYVDLGIRPDLKFGTADFSVAYWIRLPANYAAGDLPILGNAVNSANNHGYVFAPSYGTTVAGGWGWSLFGPSSGINVYGAVGSINDGGWHHLLFSFNRTGSGVTYLDGKVVDSRVISTVGDLDTATATVIGQDPSGKYPESGEADVDDMGIWKRALTPLEAAAIYLAGSVNGKSFNGNGGTATLAITTTVDGKVSLTWTAGSTLQSADSVEGPYTNVSGASSPLVVSPTAAKKFYRSRF